MAKLKNARHIIEQKETLRLAMKLTLNSTWGYCGNLEHQMIGMSSRADIMRKMDSLKKEIRELREDLD